MLKKIVLTLSAVAVSSLSGLAFAVPIAGLVNTGAGFANNALDTNYALTVTSGTTIAGSYGYVSDGIGFPDASPWLPGNATSEWLTPTANEAQSFDPTSNGVYRWRLTFNIDAMYDPATAYFVARWSTDNNGFVFLNDHVLFQSASSGFGSWSEFAVNSGFVTGTNTLDFYVTNLAQGPDNPTGVRVEFLDSNVPEPGTLALLGMAMAGLGLRRRKAA